MVTLSKYGEMNSIYFSIKSIKSGFGLENVASSNMAFENIRVFDEYLLFMKQSVASSLFDSKESILRKQNIIVGAVQLRQVD